MSAPSEPSKIAIERQRVEDRECGEASHPSLYVSAAACEVLLGIEPPAAHADEAVGAASEEALRVRDVVQKPVQRGVRSEPREDNRRGRAHEGGRLGQPREDGSHDAAEDPAQRPLSTTVRPTWRAQRRLRERGAQRGGCGVGPQVVEPVKLQAPELRIERGPAPPPTGRAAIAMVVAHVDGSVLRDKPDAVAAAEDIVQLPHAWRGDRS
eukprot:CAMPEP_0176259788 /NCGR_PEP_ID=MMETSP0121_2-20121125/39250_1 /TAXON_ID=160619 /ORGANISM="Kryptoperidinium foliaceum, Strain CCMP 1326" /LENGTH=209 /DNA_ID=CAMNT_0017599683 /DNA_START=151 /DNA_END=776 /DNA_ORIENTATION=+